jgi:KipI family sensor histidine kinase inhibitor
LKTDFHVIPVGDSAVAVEFEPRIDLEINARAIGLAEAIQAAGIAGIRDVVPTYCAVAVYFDPLRTNLDRLVNWLEQAAARSARNRSSEQKTIDVPVCYGGEFGPDLDEVARFARVTPEEVVRLHAGTTYHVFMLGFVPGFAYMGTVDPRIAAPRRSTPRLRVPQGSVAVAGGQTGIYPAETPGGWQVIGRTPLKPCDFSRPIPFLFRAGDAVHFVPILRADYERLSHG